jgi:tRNA(Ile2) C34 agmatinyltransferase TiaS
MNMTLPAAETTHELLGFATCPSCRASDANMTYDALGKGSDWQCARCGQKWSATRLATVAAYAARVSGQTDLGPST